MKNGENASDVPSARVMIVGVLLVLGLAGLYLSCAHDRPVYMSDTMAYIAGAKSIAALQGYRAGGVPMTMFPPGYSTLLAIPVSFGFSTIRAFKILNLVVSILGLLCMYFAVHRAVGRFQAALLMVLVGVFFPWVYYTSAVTSDIAFSALVGLFVFSGARFVSSQKTADLWLFSVVTALAPVLRLAGIGLFPSWAYAVFLSGGAAFGALRERRWKDLLGRVAAGLLVLVPVAAWFIRNRVLTGSASSYDLGLTPEYVLSLQKIGITKFSFMTKFWVNVRGYLHILLVPDQVGIARVSELPMWVRIAAAAPWFLVAVGWVRCLLKPVPRFFAVVAACYFGMLLNHVWYDIRYLLPVLPFYFLFLYEAVRMFLGIGASMFRVFSRSPERRATLLYILGVVFLSVCVLANVAFTVAGPKGKALRSPRYKGDIQRLYDACLFIRDSESRGSVLIGAGAGFTPLWCGRPVRSVLSMVGKDRKLRSMTLPEDVGFLILDETKFAPYRQEYLEPLVEANPDALDVVFHEGDTIVYRMQTESN
ncbi:MAG: glycosyltransferase family 39 protein [Lentisphaerae bacterium]|nr:glycosyltransferase family 39 protein [Lentisphaerota bacterium]